MWRNQFIWSAIGCGNEGKYADALTYLNEALTMQLKLHGLDHPNTLDTLHSLGITFEAESKLRGSGKVLSRSGGRLARIWADRYSASDGCI